MTGRLEDIASCARTLPAPDQEAAAAQALCEARFPEKTFQSIADSSACVLESTPRPLLFTIPGEIRCREMRGRVYDSKNTYNFNKQQSGGVQTPVYTIEQQEQILKDREDRQEQDLAVWNTRWSGEFNTEYWEARNKFAAENWAILEKKMGDFEKDTLREGSEYIQREYDQSACFPYSPMENSTILYDKWQSCLNAGDVARTALDCELENTVKCGSIESLFECYSKHLAKPGQAEDSFEPRTLNRSLCIRAYPYAGETSEFSKMRNYGLDLEDQTTT